MRLKHPNQKVKKVKAVTWKSTILSMSLKYMSIYVITDQQMDVLVSVGKVVLD